MGLVAAVTYAVSAKRLSVLSVSQGAMSAHSDESALLKAFAEIQPSTRTCTFTETTPLWTP